MQDRYLTTTTVEDIEYISPRLRKADYEECKASTGCEPLDILLDSLEIGDFCFTLRPNDHSRVGLFGVCPSPLMDNAGIIWMVATDELLEYQMKFLRRSRKYIDILQEQYAVLHNCVDARNKLHIKWLKWMGFKFIKLHEKYGAEQKPFYEFIRI